MRLILLTLAMIGSALPAEPQRVDLPGSPFKIAVAADGSKLYVSMLANGLAVLDRLNDGSLRLATTFKPGTPVGGLALTHDGKTLVASNGKGVLLIDVQKKPKVVQAIEEDGPTGSIYVNLTKDDKTLFVSNERAHSITVIDLPTRAILGRIQTGNAPIALTFSPDEKWLYTTSQAALPDWGWPDVCDSENASVKTKHPRGAVLVIDVVSHSVAKRIEAGCNPVRLALSPDGQRAYVTTRKDNKVLAFETGTFTRIAEIPVGTAPVPVAVINDGKTVLVGNSNRFGTKGDKPESISVIDAATNKVAGSLPSGAFPRDIVLSPDHRFVYIANFGSKSIDVREASKLTP